jgi:hypothetical protein
VKRLKEWLIDLHPEILDRGKAMLAGQVVEFGKINNSRLQAAIREHYADGQRAMAGFIRWLVRHEGLSEGAAKMNAANIWNALCVTWDAQEGVSHPEELWRSSAYSKSSLSILCGYMRRWARYTKDPALPALIDEIRKRDRPIMVTEQMEKKFRVVPYTDAELDAVLEATERLRGDPRWPWGWPIIRLVIVGGVRTSEVMFVTRIMVKQALAGDTFMVHSHRSGTRALPTQLIRDELEFLMNWPWSWGSIVDIVSPRFPNPDLAIAAIGRLSKHVFGIAGVEMQEHWSISCRWSSALRYYRTTGCLVGASHIIGSRRADNTRIRLQVLDERQKRREESLGKKRRRRRSVVADQVEAEGGGDEREVAQEGGGVAD